MQSNVEEQKGATKALVPVEIEYESRDREGDAVDEARVEELLRAGFRPEDARRIERMERTLDLPAEKEELNRVRAAAICRSDPDARREAIRRILDDLHTEKIVAYEALRRLHQLEIEDQDLNFARFVEKSTTFGAPRMELILYSSDGTAKKVYRRTEGRQFEVKRVSQSPWHPDLPK